MSVKCEEPVDEPTVKVWLLNHPNLNIALCKRNRIADRQTDDPIQCQVTATIWCHTKIKQDTCSKGEGRKREQYIIPQTCTAFAS